MRKVKGTSHVFTGNAPLAAHPGHVGSITCRGNKRKLTEAGNDLNQHIVRCKNKTRQRRCKPAQLAHPPNTFLYRAICETLINVVSKKRMQPNDRKKKHEQMKL
jgi:hypothetical protein